MFIELVVPFTLKVSTISMTSALFTEVIGRLQHFDSIVPSSHQLAQVIMNIFFDLFCFYLVIIHDLFVGWNFKNIFLFEANLVIQFQIFMINLFIFCF